MNINEIDAASLAVCRDPADINAIANLLEVLGAASGDVRCRRAAGHLRGSVGGRPTVDDSKAVATMVLMLECGDAKSVRRAAELAAPSGDFSEATVARLEKKYRAEAKSRRNY